MVRLATLDHSREAPVPLISNPLLVQHLEAIAARLEVEVRYEDLADDEIAVQSGGCRLLGRSLIIIDRRCPPDQRARILARELSRYDLDSLYILPQIREFILLQSLMGL
ncbi:MAG: hypothetical protein HY697_04100 [Deltaproteobacteria bacterium]|nr:hypothetical protein [Deltaproteobacteria bacterium]